MTLSALGALLAVGALWRVASLLVHEEGPRDCFTKLREWAGIEHNDEGEHMTVPNTWAAKLLDCVWCMSQFLSFPLALGLIFAPEVTFIICLPFALSAGAIVLDRITQYANR